MKVLQFIACILLCLRPGFVSAQLLPADSVFAKLKAAKDDTARFRAYMRLEEDADPKLFFTCMDSCFSIAQRLKTPLFTVNTYVKTGNYLSYRGENKKALGNYFKAADLCKLSGDKKRLTACYNNAANCYDVMGFYDKALFYYFECLKLKEEIHQTDQYLARLNIAVVYFNLKQYQQAIAYCYQALPDATKLKDQTRETEIYHNLGNNYADLHDYKKAEECYQKAIAIAESEKNDFNVTNSSLGMADLYNRQQQYEKALDYTLKALELARTNHFNEFETTAINELGMIAFYKKDYGTAEKHLKKGLEMARQYEVAIEIGNAYELLSKLYEEQHKAVDALHYYKLYSAFKDSLINDNKTQMLSNLQENYEIEKQQQQNQSLQAQNDISVITIREQKRFSTVVVIALILTAGLAFFVFRGLRKQRRANEVISAQKREVEHQKQMLDEKQQEILDSIYYARRIQRSLLPSEKYIDKNLKKLGN